MASYADNLDSSIAIDVWLAQLRDNEGFARRIELKNLSMPLKQRSLLQSDLRICAVWLSMDAVANPDTRDDFFAAVRKPMRLDPQEHAPVTPEQAQAHFDRIRTEYEQTAADRTDTSRTVEWRVQNQPDLKSAGEVLALYRDYPRDALGRVGMVGDAWKSLASHYAPTLIIESDSKADQPGQPRWDRGVPVVDREQPVVHWQVSYARVGEGTLVQLNYFVWFGESEKTSNPERLSNGLIWRVTLDPSGKPLAYESMRMDGTKHLWFPTERLAARDDATPRIPQGSVDADSSALRLQTQSHAVVRVLSRPDDSGEVKRRYRLRPYENLMKLETSDGETRSLFDPEGYVHGSRQSQSGPGMRQLGRHSLAPRENWFFDDPYLLTGTFELPEAVAGAIADQDKPDMAASKP